MAQAVAILGTASDVGKSLVSAGICRLLYRAGVKVAPFKAQNMSLNSFVTLDGGEMGRAQVLQAEACGVEPHVDMNPILLKPEADHQSQVIVQGKVWKSQEAGQYFSHKEHLWEVVQSSYQRLAEAYSVIVIEGAGSAAEINLRDRDIVNWPVVEFADATVVLVADIDRGGVFAQIFGTLDLLSEQERKRVQGIVINKFRGDLQLFEDGVRMIEDRTGVPVLGVLPFLRPLELDQEDSVDIERYQMTPFATHTVNIAVILLPHMSNFTDFNHLVAESDVAFRYAASPDNLRGADVVILPGSKTTIADLDYLKQAGWEVGLKQYVSEGQELIGICGGFQMLGQKISDPHHVETGGEQEGFGLLSVSTELSLTKYTSQIHARPLHLPQSSECMIQGYEIHMGVTEGKGVEPCFEIHADGNKTFDGAKSASSLVWGTYRARKGLTPLEIEESNSVSARLGEALDRWADHVEHHVNWRSLFQEL
jgi:adenosylcobyric acid synthase